jgi:thymidylate kinase
LPEGAAVREERGFVEMDYTGSSSSARKAATVQSNDAGSAGSNKAAIRSLLKSLEQKGVRYCHWKSNIRLEATLAAAEDIDLLVDPGDAGLFYAALLENGLKLTQSRSGIGHPGFFHAVGLDEASAASVHVHAYFQIVSGDSLVKSYRLPVERSLLEQTRYLHGVRVPTAEAELVLFALRIALKQIGPIEILMANRDYGKVSTELGWLREAANAERAEALCTAWFPTIDAPLFRQLLDAIEAERALARRVVIGWRVARRLRGLRRLNPVLGAVSRLWRVLSLLVKRLRRRRDLVLQSRGIIVALVGPKATGKSTIADVLSTRLGLHLDVIRIHAGKPPATVLTFLPRLLVPAARLMFSKERAGEYEKPERRRENRYSLLYILRMTLLAYDRRKLLSRALRAATAGSIVISDRYPSESVGAIDSCCFDEAALARCSSPLKRWLMNQERALYKGLPRPDLLLRLEAPIETTIERDARRLKQGGPDAAAVRRRWELETRPECSETPAIRIDTSRPLDETVRTVVGAVWSAL